MDTSETLTPARLDRQNQGSWEAEYSYGGEADLHRHYDNCEKNPGHNNFIPVDKFSIEDLPEDYRDQDMVDFIRAVSNLTVRVTVKYVSDMRPETVPGSDKPYPGFNVRGQRRMAVGTGYVEEVTVYNGSKGNTCKCKDCGHSCTPETNFAIINLDTVKHNVFDDSEAEETTCHLFFDRGSTPDACSGVIPLTGMSVELSDMHRGVCCLIHYTHDVGLAQRLQEIILLKRELDNKMVKNKYYKYKYIRRPAPADKQPFCFIVSHPHGCSKQISLGGFTSIYIFNSEITSNMYNTATCPGSSGAKVCMLESPLNPLTFTYFACHCGAADAQPVMNYCLSKISHLTGDFFRLNDEVKIVSMEMLEVEEGSAEYKLHCGVEEGLHKHYDTCQKNPGHQNFFPVEKFSMDNLPLSYRKPLIMEAVKLMSDLTVRLSVKCVKKERHETAPGTDITHPRHSSKGGNRIRVGSGWVIFVDNFRNAKLNKACDCKECLNFLIPKTKFAHIIIETAAEFNYIRPEREQVTCLLSLSSNTPDTCGGVVTLTDLCKIKIDNLTNIFNLTYVTHDMNLVHRLKCKLISLRNCISRDFTMCHSLQISKAEKVRKNPEQEPPLYIKVSHPHGSTKQVSIDYHGNAGNSDTEEDCSPFRRITCPGSIGAPSFVFGGEYLYPWRK